MNDQQLWQAEQLVRRSWWTWRPGCGIVYLGNKKRGRVVAVAKAGIFVQMDGAGVEGTGNTIYQRLIAAVPGSIVPDLADPEGATQGILQRMLNNFIGGELPPEAQDILEQTNGACVQALLSLRELPA